MSTNLHMKLRSLLGAMAFVALLWGCNIKPTDDGYQVTGKIEGHANAKVFLDRVMPDRNVVIDSAETDGEGQFALSTHKQVEGIYSVRLPNRQSIFVYASAEPATITANEGQFSSGKAAGNKGTRILGDLNYRRGALRSEFVQQMRGLKSLNREMNPEGWSAQEMKGDRASEAYRDYLIAFADSVSLPELAHYAVSQLNVQGDFYHMQQYVEQQRALDAKSTFLTDIETKVLEHGDPYLRMEAIDFKMATYKGDSVALSDLRDKVVYFYVWASYCGMSRMENQRLAAWYDAHPNSGIEIYSYSIDVDEKAWRRVIAEDSLHWPVQVRGDNEWSSLEIGQFGIKSIPMTFLLDAKGIIRSKGLHASELIHDADKIVKRWGPQ